MNVFAIPTNIIVLEIGFITCKRILDGKFLSKASKYVYARKIENLRQSQERFTRTK